MSLPCARLTDICSGHGCFPSRPNIQGSPTDFCNGLPKHRQTDAWATHCCGGCHEGNLLAGSPTVFTDGLQQGRLTDPVNCGSVVASGSPDTFIGDNGLGPSVTVIVDGQILTYDEKDFGGLDDEPGFDDGLAIYPPVPPGRLPTNAEKERSKKNGVDPDAPPPTPKEEDKTEPEPKETPPPSDCGEVPPELPDNFQLSSNFTLGSVSSLTALSKAKVRPQHGLTAVDIVCNLKALSENVLESFAGHFGRSKMIITSGFRPASNGSQHEKGQAVDIQIAGFSDEDYWQGAQWIKDNLNYDQFILEYLGNRPWFHLSWSKTACRRQVLTAGKNGKYESGLIRYR